MSNDKPFKLPGELEKKEPTEQVSTRIKASAKEALEKAADKEGQTLSWIAGRVLENYADWLLSKKR